MATGHLNPGYKDPVSRLRRSKSAIPFGSKADAELNNLMKPLDGNVLDEIRRQARETWSRPSTSATTYNDFHNEAYLKNHVQANTRPTSPSRKNKPHPPLVFLTNRLHYIEGFQNADTTLGKRVYKVDGSAMAPIENAYRQSLRAKYESRPNTATVMQYKRTEGLDALDSKDAQITDAWIKMSNDNDRRDIIEKLKELDQSTERRRSAAPIPSLRGYLKQAGYTDRKAWDRLQNNSRIEYNPNPANNNTIGARKYSDVSKMRRSVYKPIPSRGDFVIHPDWPPTIAHHKLPCLC
ncbi:uncharacterized protein LOC141905672 [Tubulanus polymorphus]|uniref:uncharacterized protein LOC141905672 n=1 Tax=Tubulanus polymorphus TaxID=672921 RepID=UPI003DA309E1